MQDLKADEEIDNVDFKSVHCTNIIFNKYYYEWNRKFI